MAEIENKSQPFTESGDCTDEVILSFDDGKELYVSENFLGYSSPVFKAMFKSGFKENDDKRITLKGKTYDNMLELLMCLHPSFLQPVERCNALDIIALADEYQINVIREKCNQILEEWLTENNDSIDHRLNKTSAEMYKMAGNALKILSEASSIGNESLIASSIDVLSKCRYQSFMGLYFTLPQEAEGSDPIDSRTECEKLYNCLSKDIKLRLLQARLARCDIEKEENDDVVSVSGHFLDE